MGEEMKIEIGDKIGRWEVLERLSKNGRVYYHCICECGTIKDVRADHLRAGKTQSCGCLQKEKVSQALTIDLTGQQFGDWTVIGPGERPESNSQKGAFWLCQCKCGTIKSVSSHTLRNGTSQSCGCVKPRGEEKISQILQENKITFGKQFCFSDCISVNGANCFFDFIVYRQDGTFFMIEYQGKQHYEDDNWNWESPKENDKIKREYCLSKNIELLEIPYWDFERLDWKYLKEKCKL